MNRQRGFSLVEVMVVLSIVIVLSAAGVPALQDFVTKQRLKSAASDLFTDILRTRSEAIKRNTSLTLTPEGGAWANGWSLPSPVDGASALLAHAALPNVTVTGPATLTYTGSGRVQGASNPKFNMTVSNGAARCIVVDLAGRPTVQSSPC
jgi:type IV fimbrial biogenesis protein FimT